MEQFIRDNMSAPPTYLIFLMLAGLIFVIVGQIIDNEPDSDWTGKVMQIFSVITIVISISGWSYLKLKTTLDPDSIALYRTEKQVILKSYSPMIQSKRFDITSEEPGKVYINMAGKRYELETTQLKEY